MQLKYELYGDTNVQQRSCYITGVQGQRLERGPRFAMTGVKVFAKEEAVPSIPKEKLPLELIHDLFSAKEHPRTENFRMKKV